MTLVGIEILLLVIVVMAGFAAVVLSLRRLEGRQRRWVQSLSDLVATAAADNSARSLLASPRYADPRRLTRQGAKIYSQSDEDGIIDEIFRRIGTSSRRFLEIGVGDGLENNTLALLVQGWTGSWIDGSPQNAAKICARFAPMLKDGRLRFLERRVTLATLDEVLRETGGADGLDLFSLDIDGNDYHIAAHMQLTARVIVLEYNARFAPPVDWIMAYDENHVWRGSDHFGASLVSYATLLRDKGYSLVGCNLSGTNAFFVRGDLVGELFLGPFTAETHYEPARYWLIPAFGAGHRPDFRPG
ncbi:MAG TPA: hypothetical protein VGL83_09800 [Stellaceae bacterium]